MQIELIEKPKWMNLFSCPFSPVFAAWTPCWPCHVLKPLSHQPGSAITPCVTSHGGWSDWAARAERSLRCDPQVEEWLCSSPSTSTKHAPRMTSASRRARSSTSSTTREHKLVDFFNTWAVARFRVGSCTGSAPLLANQWDTLACFLVVEEIYSQTLKYDAVWVFFQITMCKHSRLP